MSPDIAVYGAAGALTTATIAVSAFGAWQRRVLSQAIRNVRGLSEWAQWTMLTVVDQDGTIHAWTLRQLYDWKIIERVWADPVSVSVWAAHGELYKQWQSEAVQLFTTPPDAEEECGG